MDENLDWTWALGEAVLAQQADVIDAVQRFRTLAYSSGNLRSDDHQVVSRNDDVIEIAPADPEVIYIPYYEPSRVVVAQPRPVYYYYPDPYPVYYYPYPVGYNFGYHFGYGFFWGVTSLFDIGWHTHYVNVYPRYYYLHPYYGRSYYAPYYARSGISINILNVNRGNHIWRPTEHRAARPHVGRGRTVSSTEGYVTDRGRPTSGGRTTISREQPAAARDGSGINRKTLPEQRRAAVSSRLDSANRLATPTQPAARNGQTRPGVSTGTSARTESSTGTGANTSTGASERARRVAPAPSTRPTGRPVGKDASNAPVRGQGSARTTIGSIAARSSENATRTAAPQNRVRYAAPQGQARSVVPQTQVRTVAPQQSRSTPPARVAESQARVAAPRAQVTQPSQPSSVRTQKYSAPPAQRTSRGGQPQGGRSAPTRNSHSGGRQR
jgi:Protein of unknown function (DUF3300)